MKYVLVTNRGSRLEEAAPPTYTIILRCVSAACQYGCGGCDHALRFFSLCSTILKLYGAEGVPFRKSGGFISFIRAAI